MLEEGSHYSVNLGGDLFRLQNCEAVLNLRSDLEYGVSPHFMSQIQSFHSSNRTPDRMLQEGTREMVLVDEGLAVHIRGPGFRCQHPHKIHVRWHMSVTPVLEIDRYLSYC